MRVDVGVVCLRLGPVAERRGVARKLAAELIRRADTLMYGAKGKRAEHVYADGGADRERRARPSSRARSIGGGTRAKDSESLNR